jgi:hypothetical protein
MEVKFSSRNQSQWVSNFVWIYVNKYDWIMNKLSKFNLKVGNIFLFK